MDAIYIPSAYTCSVMQQGPKEAQTLTGPVRVCFSITARMRENMEYSCVVTDSAACYEHRCESCLCVLVCVVHVAKS